jgi:hypothetical protein
VNRGSLLSSIQAGTKLKKTVTKDCSAPMTSRPAAGTSAGAPGVTAASAAAAGSRGGATAGFGDIFAQGKVQLRHAGGPGKAVIEKKVATLRRGTQAQPAPAKAAANHASTTQAEQDRLNRIREAADSAAKAQKQAEETARKERLETERLQSLARAEAQRADDARKAAEEARKAAEREAERRIQAAAAAEKERVRREERERADRERVEREAKQLAEKRLADERAARAAEESRLAQQRAQLAEEEAARARKLAQERAVAAAEAVASAPASGASGGSRGICSRCNQGLQGTTVQLDSGEILHAACHRCNQCAVVLGEAYCVVGSESLCDDCANRQVSKAAPHCATCGGQITSEYVVIDETPRHRQCVTCQDCKRELMRSGASASLKRWPNEPGLFCDSCHDIRANADKCDMCLRALGFGTFVTVLGKRLHEACLVCKTCSAKLSKSEIYTAGGWPACQEHGE